MWGLTAEFWTNVLVKSGARKQDRRKLHGSCAPGRLRRAMTAPSTRALGHSDIEVSRLSLGSWRTYERMPRADAEAVLSHALARGITFLDDARYDDETGAAPMRSGWSEVLFGELFRAVGADRDAVVVANKLWWEFWPLQDAVAELRGSLERMALRAHRPPVLLDAARRRLGRDLRRADRARARRPAASVRGRSSTGAPSIWPPR